MGVTLYTQSVLADSPKAFWTLQDSSGLPQDSSGNGLHMTTYDQWTPPDINHSFRESGPFPGSYSMRLHGDAFSRSTVSVATNNFTMEVWFKYESDFGRDPLLGNFNGGGDGWAIDWRSGFFTYRALVGNVNWEAESVELGSVGTWDHVVMTRDAGTWKYYINGATDRANAGTDAPSAPTGGTTRINQFNLTGNYAFAAIYETALPLARATDHFNAGFAEDPVFVPQVLMPRGISRSRGA